MKRLVYIVYLLLVIGLVFALGSTEPGRRDWDDTDGGSGWHSSGGHK